MNELLTDYLGRRRSLAEDALRQVIGEAPKWPGHLYRAMRYSVFSGGRRVRPLLVLAAYEAVAPVPDLSLVLPIATALELLHISFQVHDDLPPMDDTDTRRGAPTSHRVHGEALALIAGDALHDLAFQLLADRQAYSGPAEPALLLEIIRDVATAVGRDGTAGGLSMIHGYEGEVQVAEQLAFLYARRSGGLIRAAVLGGARIGGATEAQLRALGTFGDQIGLAHQLRDELSLESGALEASRNRPQAVPSIVGLLGARVVHQWIERASSEAQAALVRFDQKAEPLRELARAIALGEV